MTSRNGRISDEYHRPVMLGEVIDYLVTDPNGTYIDLTCGGGGHLLGLSEHLSNQANLIGVDRDPDAVKAAGNRLKSIKQKITIINNTFSRLGDVISKLGYSQIDGALFDLGVSSHQIDIPERGFSFMSDGPLDMRMGSNPRATAVVIVNTYLEHDLKVLFKKYGEEKRSGRAARAIVEARKKNKIETTQQLRAILEPVLSGKYMNASLARIFQAIRIEVNDELNELQTALSETIDNLAVGGRVVVISYHSLEDRIVKRLFAAEAKGCVCPPRTPICICGHNPTLKILTRKVVVPKEEECAENPRAASAKLRAAEKLAA